MIALDLLRRSLDRHADRPLGIMLSGGMDSAAMLAAGCVLGRTAWTVAVIGQADGSWSHAGRVLGVINHRWGLDLRAERVAGGDRFHAWRLGTGLADALARWPDHSWFSADNRTPEDLPGGPVRSRFLHDRVEQPWGSITKDEIARMAISLGLRDEIAAAHSCTEMGEGRCGLCWQCRERAWAFDRLGVADPGDG